MASVTVVLLNWKRLENTKLIVSTLGPSEDVAEIRVWNNNPDVNLKASDFDLPRQHAEKLWIRNSPKNLYFQARFLACLEVRTKFCFFQDDDYLITPNVLHAMIRRAELLESGTSIHLLAPEHYMTSVLTRIIGDNGLHTCFAWLGFGTLVPVKTIAGFMRLMKVRPWKDPLGEDELKMADNYFSILSNRAPEIWIDPGHPLQDDNAFTNGDEGEDRNWKYIQLAIDRLRALLKDPQGTSQHDFPQRGTSPSWDYLMRAACLVAPGVVETNIQFIPNTIRLRIDSPVPEPVDIRRIRRERIRLLKSDDYVYYSLAAAVDGNPTTYFKSLHYGRKGDYIALDTMPASETTPKNEARILRVVSACGCEISDCDCHSLMRLLTVETRKNTQTEWATVPCNIASGVPSSDMDDVTSELSDVVTPLLSYTFKPVSSVLKRHVRVVLTEDVPTLWKITEIVVESIPLAYM